MISSGLPVRRASSAAAAAFRGSALCGRVVRAAVVRAAVVRAAVVRAAVVRAAVVRGTLVRGTVVGGIVCCTALLSGCGEPGSSAGAPTTTVTTTVQATGPASSGTSGGGSPAGPRPCATSALRATVGSGNAAAGSSYYPIDLTNTSGASCTLFGYPGVSFVTGIGGSQVGVPAARSPGSSTLVTLAAGATAHATLQVVDALNYPASRCTVTKVHWLKIYPPGQFTALYASFSAQTCAAPHPARILAIQPAAPGASSQ
jgi:hypothetical protein